MSVLQEAMFNIKPLFYYLLYDLWYFAVLIDFGITFYISRIKEKMIWLKFELKLIINNYYELKNGRFLINIKNNQRN